jgi:hypothetical protein
MTVKIIISILVFYCNLFMCWQNNTVWYLVSLWYSRPLYRVFGKFIGK